MPAQFDAKSYISKQAFSPLSEVWDHRSKKVTSSSAKQGGVDQAVADIAATSREVCAAAIQSLNLNTGSKLDLELLDGAIATLKSVLKNTDGQLKDEHIGFLESQSQKLEALKALHAKKNGVEWVSRHQGLYSAIAADLRKVDPRNQQFAKYAAQLEGAGVVTSAPSRAGEQPSSVETASQNTPTPNTSPSVSSVTRAGAALLEKSFDFEKRAAVGAKAGDKQMLRDSVRLLMSAGNDSLPQDLHNQLNSQVTVGGSYSASGVSDQEKNIGKVGPFTLRRTVRKEAQNAILGRATPVEPRAEAQAQEPPGGAQVPQRQRSRIVEISRFNGLMRRTIQTVFENLPAEIHLTDEHQTALRANLLRQLTESAAADRFDLSQAGEAALFERLGHALDVLLPGADEFTRAQLNVELTSAFMQQREAPVL